MYALRQVAHAMLSLALVLTACTNAQPSSTPPDLPAPYDLRVEHQSNPVGISEAAPRFSYRLTESGRGVRQTAYRVVVTNSDTKAQVWDSTKTASSTTTGIVYNGTALVIDEQYSYRVTWYASTGTSATATGTFGVAPACDADWAGAAWIGGTLKQLRYGFVLPSGETIKRATAFVDAPGCTVMFANGVGVNGLAGICPWTSFDKTVVFPAYNMTGVLKAGQGNALGFQLGGSMFTSRFKGTQMLRFKMVVFYESGRKSVHVSKGTKPPPPPPPTPAPPAPTATCGEVPEKASVELSCPSGQTITAMDFVAFGTPTGTCSGTGASNANTFQVNAICNASTAYTIASQLCLGTERCVLAPACLKQVCTLAPAPSARPFADPCRMVKKHLDVAITCTPRVAAVAPAPAPAQAAASWAGTGTGTDTGTGWLGAPGKHTDDPWRGATTNWTVVARDNAAGWTTAAFDMASSPQAWLAPHIVDASAIASAVHRTTTIPPTREVRTVHATHATKAANGTCVVGFDENFVGVLVIQGAHVHVAAAGSLELVYSEVLAEGGQAVDTKWAFETHDVHIFQSAPVPSSIRPSFTWHGFQYVQVTAIGGVALDCTPSAFTGSVLNSDVERTGRISFDNTTKDGAMLNQLQRIIVRGQLSNLAQGTPTDCPTREKHGWLGDAASTAEEAMFNFEMQGVYEEYLQLIQDSQDLRNGDVPGVVPAGRHGAVGAAGNEGTVPTGRHGVVGAAANGGLSRGGGGGGETDISWSAAYPLIASWMLTHYNNVRVAERHWSSLKHFVDGLEAAAGNSSHCPGGIPNFWTWGDWCAVASRAEATPGTGPVLAAFNYILSLDAMVQMGQALGGRDADVARYQGLAQTFRTRFHGLFYNASTGTYGHDPMLVQSLTTAPLAMGNTIPAPLYANVVARLVDNVAAQGTHLTVGSVGAKHLLPELARAGQQKAAMQIATQTTYPSFGYWLSKGATTCWENYSGEPDPSHPPTPTHNHIFLCGGLGEWMYRSVGGISPGRGKANGYAHVDIFPDVVAGSGPDQANVSVATVGGLIHVAWTRRGHGVAKGNGHGVDLTASIPPAVHTASVMFRAPEHARAHITEGGQTVWSSSAGFTGGGRVGVTAAEWVPDQGGRVRVDVGPGTYVLVFSMRP